MYRRQVLAGSCIVALTSLAGCLGSNGDPLETDGDDDNPIDASPGDLLLDESTANEILDNNWDVITDIDDDSLMFLDADIIQVFRPWDAEEEVFREMDGRYYAGVWLYDDVDTARDAFENNPYYFGHGLEEDVIAVESLSGLIDVIEGFSTDEWGYVLFRDANAIGAVGYRNLEIDPPRRVDPTRELASELHQTWRT